MRSRAIDFTAFDLLILRGRLAIHSAAALIVQV
jgi:hypothetical protein